MAPKCTFGEGCTKPVTYRPDVNPTVTKPSKFCDKHTCAFIDGDDPCFKKVVKNGETRCQTHFECEARLCDKPRLQVANGGWCACCGIHKCKEESCMNLREYNNSKDKYFKYCLKHKCTKPECENSKAGLKQQCKTHTCTQESCANIIADDEKLCTLHLQCKTASCTRKRALRQGQYHIFCSQHLICETIACSRDKRDDSRFCISHTCLMRNCTQTSGLDFYCTDHTCEVTSCHNGRALYVDKCNGDTPVKSPFCPIHECRKADCHEASRNSTFGYCADHNCNRADCNSLKLIDPDSNPPLLLCRKHYDESLNPPPKEVPKTPTPAPAPVPQKPDQDFEKKLNDLKREQREQRDKLDNILRILDRQRW